MYLTKKKPIEEVIAEAQRQDGLLRSLDASSLVMMGLGAIIGAGIFTLAGTAAAQNAGPAIIWSFVLAALGCAFAGFCYAEFASMLPVSGSAYTYAYVTGGELLAWIIGWDLVLEYAVGSATVSIGWSGTAVSLLNQIGIHLPPRLLVSPMELVTLPNGATAHGLANVPAALVVVLISVLLMRGTRESALINNIIVVVKVAVLLTFIVVGWHYIDRHNYVPFMPPAKNLGEFGYGGILRAAGIMFFAYIGFDAVSTASQETKNPKRDVAIGIIGSLLLCTVLFILYAHVLTGVVHYSKLNVSSPLTVALDAMQLPWLGLLMKVAVLSGLTSVMLVMLLGQSRIFFAMSRDGLLPKAFSFLHRRFRTPYLSNLVLMVFVGLFASFVPLSVVGQMTSIGTLFAFALVSIGIIVLRRTHPHLARPFRVPFVPAFPIIGAMLSLILMLGLGWQNWLRLVVWLVIGFIIYFLYSRRQNQRQAAEASRSTALPRLERNQPAYD